MAAVQKKMRERIIAYGAIGKDWVIQGLINHVKDFVFYFKILWKLVEYFK